MPIERLLRCPYCARRGSLGVVAIDLDAVSRLPLGPTDVREFGSNEHAQRPAVFVFNPDGVPNGPCPHLISCLLDADVVRLQGRRIAARRSSVTLSWDHRWFARHDRDNSLNIALWTELENSVDDALDPQTPYVNSRVEWVGRLPGSRSSVVVSATMFFAADAQRFLSGLQKGFGSVEQI